MSVQAPVFTSKSAVRKGQRLRTRESLSSPNPNGSSFRINECQQLQVTHFRPVVISKIIKAFFFPTHAVLCLHTYAPPLQQHLHPEILPELTNNQGSKRKWTGKIYVAFDLPFRRSGNTWKSHKKGQDLHNSGHLGHSTLQDGSIPELQQKDGQVDF